MKAMFLTDTAPSPSYPLSLHDALPISEPVAFRLCGLRGICPSPVTIFRRVVERIRTRPSEFVEHLPLRSEEHTSELQSQFQLVCRLLLEKKNRSPGSR